MEKDNIRIKKVLEDMSYAINHIEDMMADNRAVIIKLVKQTNQIVKFLKDIQFDVVEDYDDKYLNDDEKRIIEYRSLLDSIRDQSKDLQEFEEELEKHKDKLTPGQIGES